VVVYVGLAGVLVFEILMPDVGVLNRSMIMFVVVGSAEMLKSARHPVVIMSDMEVRMGVREGFVIVLFPFWRRAVDCQ
jgi:hypothetical protein